MIKALKLQKAIYLLIVGVIFFVMSNLSFYDSEDVKKILLILSGIFLIVGSLWLLYPIIFAKKLSPESNIVKLETAEADDDLKE